MMLRNSIFKLLSKVLIDFSISCCRFGGGGGLLEDGTGVLLDGVGVVALEGGGLSIMVGGGNARWKRTEDGRGCWWDKFRIVWPFLSEMSDRVETWRYRRTQLIC